MTATLRPARVAAVLLVLLTLLALALVAALCIGPSGLAPGAVLGALRGRGDPVALDIVRAVRLPRALLAAGVGGSLALAGVLFQALLRNPLADPFILGVSGGAALGGIAVLVLGGAAGLGYDAAPLASFAGAALSLLVLFAVAGRRGRLSPTTLLLTGVVLNAFASAAIVFLASTAGLAEGASLFLWLIGSLSDARRELLIWVAGFLALGGACAAVLARGLNLLALGEEPAEQLGLDVDRTRRVLLVATSLMVGAAVAVSGLIGFVGLIVPHLLRLLLGPDHRLLVPASVLGGAAFLVLCDTGARTVLGARELPVGAITALLGGPLFLVLLRRGASVGRLP
jgi:iron complex transport system permease protein